MNMRKTKAICPKCKSNNLTIIEISNAYQFWNQENGVINRSEGIMEPGDIIRVEGKCNESECGHRWRFKCLQIDNLLIDN